MRKEMLLVLLSLVLALAAAEGLLRGFPALLPLELQIALEDRSKTRGVSHPYIGNLHTPNATHVVRTPEFEIPYPTDAHGFNNAGPWPATADIVAVGDSLTFGYGVAPDEAWPALIARELPDSKVVNLGLIGAGPQQHLRLYETFGVPLKPKILLIGFFLANDFWDAEKFDAWLKSGVGGNYMVWRDFVGDRTAFLGDAFLGDALRSSYLYHWARFVREVYRDWRAGEPKDLQLADGSHVKLRPDDLAEKTAYIEPGNPIFDLSLDALKRINAVATSHGTHVIVVLQPGKEETYLPLLDGTPADPGAPLRAALEARGIEYLDLLPLFREQAAAGPKLFYEFDGHPNAEGYRLTAEKILAYLADNAERYGLEPPDWAMNWGTSVETTPAVASHRANRKSCAETRRTPTRRE
jgi:lysophospholipase L1-like esterase